MKKASMSQRKARLLGTLVLAAVTLTVLMLGNPYSQSWFMKCPLFALTGWQCPLCGMQRQLHELMHLNLATAWRLNQGLMLGYPYIVLLIAGQVDERFMHSRVGRWCYKDKTILTFIAALLVWGVTRHFI